MPANLPFVALGSADVAGDGVAAEGDVKSWSGEGAPVREAAQRGRVVRRRRLGAFPSEFPVHFPVARPPTICIFTVMETHAPSIDGLATARTRLQSGVSAPSGKGAAVGDPASPRVPALPGKPTSRPLPSEDRMYAAVRERDTRYDGIFFLGVRTTGIFCRPGCPARTPLRRNVDFFPSARAALAHGFRPCKRCRPMEPRGETPAGIRELMTEVEGDPGLRLRDRDLRARGLDPVTLRRWFQKHHGMTFHGWQRGLRLAAALGHLSRGAPITTAAFDSGYDSLSGFQDALRNLTGRPPSRSRNTMVVHLTRIVTPLGPMLLGATDQAVCLLEFTDRRMLETQLSRLEKQLASVFVPGGNEVTARLEEELERYFRGDLADFTTPLLTVGTPFQRRVWEGLLDIPYGETRSYGAQARALGSPEAVRAVARANGDNRIAIVIPCHRVIGADGSLTGYGGGLERKRFLLDLERGHRPGAQTALEFEGRG